MEREAASIPEPEAGSEEGALADLDARKGVISNPHGGHEVGRTSLSLPRRSSSTTWRRLTRRCRTRGDPNLHSGTPTRRFNMNRSSLRLCP